MVIVTFIGIYNPGRIGAFSEFSFSFTLPVIIFAPIAGVVVDHVSKRKVICNIHVIQALIIALTPFFIRLTNSMLPIWFTVFLFFGLDIFNNSARGAIIPSIVAREDILQANSILIFGLRIATFGGMVLGGLLIDWVGWHLGFYLDALTHFIAGMLALGMVMKGIEEKVPPLFYKDIANSLKQFYKDLWELVILLGRDRVVIFVITSVFILYFVAAVSYTILIYIVQQVLKLGSSGVGWLGGTIGIGQVLAALLLGWLGKNLNRFLVIIISVTLLGLFFIVGQFYVTTFLLFLISFFAGIFFSFIGICQDTLLQEDVGGHIRGRIFSTKEFIASASFLGSALLIGALSEFINYRALLFFVGILLILLALFTFLIIPKAYLKKPTRVIPS